MRAKNLAIPVCALFALSGAVHGGRPVAGNGFPYPRTSAVVSGRILEVSGSRVLLLLAPAKAIAIDDAQALKNGAAQSLAAGEEVTALGYWSGGRFFALSITQVDPSGVPVH